MQKYSPISKIYTLEITNIEFIEVLIDKCKGQLLIIYTDFIFFFFFSFFSQANLYCTRENMANMETSV